MLLPLVEMASLQIIIVIVITITIIIITITNHRHRHHRRHQHRLHSARPLWQALGILIQKQSGKNTVPKLAKGDPFVTPSPKKKNIFEDDEGDDSDLLSSAKQMAPIPANKKVLKASSFLCVV